MLLLPTESYVEQELLRLKDKTVKDDQTRKDVCKTVTQSGLIQSGRANTVCTIVHVRTHHLPNNDGTLLTHAVYATL